jgi:hypothetical protein
MTATPGDVPLTGQPSDGPLSGGPMDGAEFRDLPNARRLAATRRFRDHAEDGEAVASGDLAWVHTYKCTPSAPVCLTLYGHWYGHYRLLVAPQQAVSEIRMQAEVVEQRLGKA